MWDLLARRTPWSTIDADRVDQMCAQSAAQSARRSVNWPAAHRIPMAHRWLICTLYAACVRWSAARARCHGHPSLNHGHRAGWWPSVRHAYPYAPLSSGPRRGVSAPGGGLAPIPPPNREDETMKDTVDQAHSAMPPAPSPTSARMHGTVDLTVFSAPTTPGLMAWRERCRDDRDTRRRDKQEEGQAGADRGAEAGGGAGGPGPGAGRVADRPRRAAQAADQDGAGNRAEPGDDRAPRS